MNRVVETDAKVEFSVTSSIEDEELSDSDKGMAGVFRVVGVACATLVGCLVGIGGTIWVCLKGKKAIEQSIN